MKRFIRIGTLYLNVNDIIEVDTNHQCEGGSFVRVTMRTIDADGYVELASVSTCHHFVHGAPDADAIIAWVASQAEVLL